MLYLIHHFLIELRNIVLKPYTKSEKNSKPSKPITYPHEPAIFLGTPEDPQRVIARLGGTANLVFRLDNVSPDKLFWYYVDSSGSKKVIARTEDMKKFSIADVNKHNAYR